MQEIQETQAPSNKELYAEWVQNQPDLPIFLQPWWLDAVCAGKQWDVLLVWDSHHIVAVMPYLIRYKFRMLRFILMPQESQICGPWIAEGADADFVARELSRQIEELKVDYYYQQYPLRSRMPQAMQKQGFRISERVTYRIEDLSDMDTVLRHFSKNKARQLKKAETHELTVDLSMSAEEFYRFHHQSLIEQGKRISYTREFLLVLERKTRRAGMSQIVCIRDQQGHACAAAYLVWDAHSMYYLIPAFSPTYRDVGAGAKLVYEAILLAKEKGLIFDFEGSMIPSVANHYRQFGSDTTIYYGVEKYYRWWFRLLMSIHKLSLKRYKLS